MEQDQATVSPAAYQLPVTPPRPGKKRTLIIVGVIVAILVIISAAAAAFFYYPPFAALKSALTLPQELKGATFLADGPDGTTAYTLKGFSYKATSLAGTLVSADAPQNTQVLRDANGMYTVLANGKKVFASTTPIAGVSVSDDGSVVTAATANQPGASLFEQATQLPMVTIDSTAWHILYSQSVGDGSLQIPGPTGVAPLVLANGTVVYLSPAGISSWNPRAGTVTVLVPRTLRLSPLSVLQSPDGSKIGFRDSVAQTITIYTVTATSADVVSTIALKNSVSSYSLGNDGLYAVKRSVIGSEIWKQGFAEEGMHRIGFLPKNLNITRLLIGSL